MTDKSTTPGILIISLDFELFWGMRDKKSLHAYEENLIGVHVLVPKLLQLFTNYRIHATWATVGFLFFEARQQLEMALPSIKPAYEKPELSPYPHIETIGEKWQDDPYHYAPQLIRDILATPGQEIGSHTFSHYYCLENGQTTISFRQDLEAARAIAAQWQIPMRSLVFPRNQYDDSYLAICREMGVVAYRGTESSWLYKSRRGEAETAVRRFLRLVDAYLNLSGHHTYPLANNSGAIPINIPSSRFLRPYSPSLRWFEPVRLQRISRDLVTAAEKGEVYHLWWHPHNFGRHMQENLLFLQNILEQFKCLQDNYGMLSLNMGELSARVLSS